MKTDSVISVLLAVFVRVWVRLRIIVVGREVGTFVTGTSMAIQMRLLNDV